MRNLLEQFNNINRMPLFEIDDEVYHIHADESGIYAGGCTNTGFKPYNGLFIEWDDTFPLDEHLQALHDLCSEVTI